MPLLPVLITAPEGYARRFCTALSETEGNCFPLLSVPMIETVLTADNESIKRLAAHIGLYQYLAFSSRKAIDALAAYQENSGFSIPEKTQCCDIGKYNDYLTERLGICPAFRSEEPSPTGIVRTLSARPDIRQQRIAVLAPVVTGMKEPDTVPQFIRDLQKIGMTVDRIDAYITRAASSERLEEVCRMICLKQIRCIAFTSATEADVLLKGLVRCGLNPSDFPTEVTTAVFGPYTANHIRKSGLRVDFVSPDFESFKGFALSLSRYLLINHK
jgi:uroporphyrinogen-III synthase